jgi:hypothetical protein
MPSNSSHSDPHGASVEQTTRIRQLASGRDVGAICRAWSGGRAWCTHQLTTAEADRLIEMLQSERTNGAASEGSRAAPRAKDRARQDGGAATDGGFLSREA